MPGMQPFDAVRGLENARPLDRVVDPVRRVVQGPLPPGPARDALHGVPIGHPVHPTLVQVSIGAFMSASVLDALPGNEAASSALVATGLASAAPAAVTGWADWSELHEQQQRVGLVHAAANATGVALYALSLAARMRGLAALRQGPRPRRARDARPRRVPRRAPVVPSGRRGPTTPRTCRTWCAPAGRTSARSTS